MKTLLSESELLMQSTTLQKLEEAYGEFPQLRADGVPQLEINEAASQFGIPFPEDNQEFLRRYGGGHVGPNSVAGPRRWGAAANVDWSVTQLTTHYRKQNYPGNDRWVIFSDECFGNPIGFDELGRIWISDHDSCKFVCIEESFENWLRHRALKIAEFSNPNGIASSSPQSADKSAHSKAGGGGNV